MAQLMARLNPLSGRKGGELPLALRGATPEEALRLAAPAIESLLVSTDLGSPGKFRRLFGIDEAVQPHLRVLTEAYLAALRADAPKHRQLWQQVHSHFALLSDAYAECLGGLGLERLPGQAAYAELTMRAIRAGAQQGKWEAFRYGPGDERLWPRLNLAYRRAAQADTLHMPVCLRPGRATESTAEGEYIRAVALFSLGPDQLDAERLEMAARLIHYVLPSLELTARPDAASLHWVDCEQGRAPARIVRLPQGAARPRFFSGMAAVPALEELLETVLGGDVPAALSSGGATPARIASVLAHMVRMWSGQPPTRHHRRHPLAGQLRVVEGLLRFAERLTAGSGPSDGASLQTWNIRDASLQGLGVEVPIGEAGGVCVGALVGMHSTDGDRWRVGAVRRMWRTSETLGQVGIELLGGSPLAMAADDGATALRVILLEPLGQGRPVRVLVPLPGPRREARLYLLEQGKAIKLEPLTTLEYGADYEIRAYLCP